MPRAHSAWRVDFEEDGYRAFLRPVSDYEREAELSLFCNNHFPGSLFLSMDIPGPAEKIKSAMISATLDAQPIKYVSAPFLVSQIDDLYSRVTNQIEKQNVPALLTKVNALSLTLSFKHPYQPMSGATTYPARSRPALIFAVTNCVNSTRVIAPAPAIARTEALYLAWPQDDCKRLPIRAPTNSAVFHVDLTIREHHLNVALGVSTCASD